MLTFTKMFPSFEFGWLLPEFESAVRMELGNGFSIFQLNG